MYSLRWLLLVTLLVPGFCLGQKKIPVEVALTGEDRLGQLVMQELREAIRAFQGPLVLPEGEGATLEAYGMRVTVELSRPRIKLQLATTEGDPGQPGNSAAVSVTVLYDSDYVPLGGAFIKSMLVTCGRNDAAACAKQILTRANGSIEWLRERWPSLWKTL